MATSPNPFFALAGLIDKGLSGMKKRAEHRDVISHIDYAHQKHLEALSHQAGIQHETIRTVAGEARQGIAGGGRGRVSHGPEGTTAEYEVAAPAAPVKKTAAKKATPAKKAARAPRGQGTLATPSGAVNPRAVSPKAKKKQSK